MKMLQRKEGRKQGNHLGVVQSSSVAIRNRPGGVSVSETPFGGTCIVESVTVLV